MAIRATWSARPRARVVLPVPGGPKSPDDPMERELSLPAPARESEGDGRLPCQALLGISYQVDGLPVGAQVVVGEQPCLSDSGFVGPRHGPTLRERQRCRRIP